MCLELYSEIRYIKQVFHCYKQIDTEDITFFLSDCVMRLTENLREMSCILVK